MSQIILPSQGKTIINPNIEGLTAAIIGGRTTLFNEVTQKSLTSVNNHSATASAGGFTATSFTGGWQEGFSGPITTESVTSMSMILGVEISSEWGLLLSTEGNGTFIGTYSGGVLQIRHGGTDSYSSGGVFPANKFCIISASFYGTACKAYINGVEVINATSGGGSSSVGSYYFVGGNPGGGSVPSKIAFAYLLDRPITIDEHKAFYHTPTHVFQPKNRVIYFDVGVGAGGGSNLSQTSRFDNSNSFYAHTVITGAVTLSADLFSNGNTFYAHTVTQGGITQTLAQSSSFQNSNSFYASTVTPGSINLTASLFTNATTLFNPSVTVGSVTLFADLLNNSNTFYNQFVSIGGGVLQQTIRLDNVNLFYSSGVTPGAVDLSFSLLNNSNLFYGAFVSTGNFVLQQTSRFDNSGAFYEINVAVGSVTLTTNLFTNSNTFFTHTTSQVSLLELTQSVRFDNTSNFYVAAIGAGTTLTPADIAAIMTAMRIEFATELARLDVAISSRLASVDYTAPNNAGIAALPNVDEIATAVMHYTE